MRALVMIQPPEVVPALAGGLKDASGDMRKVASAGLGEGGGGAAGGRADLVDALRDPEVQVRANAAHALARLDALPVEAVPALIEAASDARDDLRMNAALALGKAPPARTAAVFAQLIEDPNPRIRLIAARSVLSQDAADAGAVAVVKAALDGPGDQGPQGGARSDRVARPRRRGVAGALKERAVLEEDPKLQETADRLVEPQGRGNPAPTPVFP